MWESRGSFILPVLPPILFLTLWIKSVVAAPTIAGMTNSGIAWTHIYQNNLNVSDDVNHVGALLTSALTSQHGLSACKAAGELPMTQALLEAHHDDFIAAFNYLCYSGKLVCPQRLWIEGGVVLATESATSLAFPDPSTSSKVSLPQLCTQSSAGNMAYNSAPTSRNQVAMKVGQNGNTYVGYRNQKSFRFLGVRFAPEPDRFTHSQPDTSQGQTYDNTRYKAECMQGGAASMSEDCLFLNIQTPYIPEASSSNPVLRPVLLNIHGGALIVGSSNDWTTDGGSLASREDVVVVNVNYRLGTYGFLAVPETSYTGNYGLGDVITALQWTKNNIAYFGGDASRVTVVGESAGAALVRALVGSPKAQGLFHSAIAMSNLGGAVDLGEDGDWGTANTFYYSIEESFQKAGESILTDVGCDTGSNVDSKLNCLLSTSESLSALNTQAQWLVQDGKYITTQFLDVGQPSSVASKVPFISGTMSNDGASFIGNNASCTSEVDCLASNLGISKTAAQSIIDSKLFPFPASGNNAADSFNVSQHVRTDDTFRCVDQATAYAAAKTSSLGPVYYYQNNRGNGGYNPAGVADGSISNSASTAYYRLHSGDTAYAFGNLVNIHGAPDLRATRLLTAYWGAFVRSGNPNPDAEMLRQRGYMDTWRAVSAMGDWKAVVGEQGPMLWFDDPPKLVNEFADVEECKWLNYSLDYFLVNPQGRR